MNFHEIFRIGMLMEDG